MINGSSDGEALIAWELPYIVDMPTSLLSTFFIHEETNDMFATTYLWIGFFHWGIIGYLLQALVGRLIHTFGTTKRSRTMGSRVPSTRCRVP